jgi:protein-arginine kinase activator protein McsA
MTSPLAGMKMLVNPADGNTRASICRNCAPPSKAIDSSDFQSSKHSSWMSSTLAEIKIVLKPVDKNAARRAFQSDSNAPISYE